MAWQLTGNLAPRAVPPGTIILHGGRGQPAGWLRCDGTPYNIADYPDLYSAIGTAYGQPNAAQFTVPNFTGRFPFGAPFAYVTGSTGGAATHSHPLSDNGSAAIGVNNTLIKYRSVNRSYTATNTKPISGTVVADTSGGSATAALLGDTDDASSMPPYVAVNFLIKT